MEIKSETSTGPPKMFSWRVELACNAARSRKEAGVKDLLSCNSKTMGVPGRKVITFFLIFRLFILAGWRELIALATEALR
jgi:hypothetical protein